MTENWPTGLRLHEGETWPVPCDKDADGMPAEWNPGNAQVTLRRIGWLDQKGRVWLVTPAGAQFDGGSLIPLLIDAREG